ncbi:MAG: peptidoglycan D,D-transpeptidase FtsI family protein [Actinomycetota bacterium]
MNNLNALPPRRLRLLITISLIAVVVFTIRLIDFQIVSASAINQISYEKRAVTRIVPALRGDIVDRNGEVLATTVYRYDINAAPAMVKPVERQIDGISQTLSVESIAVDLARILEMDVAELLPKLVGTSNYVNLKKRVDAETFRQIDELEIPWIYADAHQDRLYPNGAVAGNLLGFVGTDGEALAGIERQYNACLAGVDGQETFEKGVDGIKIPSSTVVVQEAKPGRTVVLSIDADLQYQAQQVLASEVKRLNADWATAVVIEVKTGKIVLAAEAPSVDPNDPGKSKPEDRGAKVFQFAYEPGSTMKAVTAATAIETGYATVGTRVKAPSSLQIYDRVVRDSFSHETLRLTLAGVLRYSSNTGTIKIAENIPAKVRYQFMKKFGFGSPTEVRFEGETSGVLNDYKDWDGVTNYTTMFGQALSVSPVQMASVYQTLANQGVRLNPILVAGCQDENGEMTSIPTSNPTQVVSASTAMDVMLMLEKVVEQGGIGQVTAVSGYRSAGKTGTAEIKEGTGYGRYYAASFFGMAPVDNPEYAMGVMIYKPKRVWTNSMAAAAGYQKILSQVLLANRVPPSTTKSPEIATEW